MISYCNLWLHSTTYRHRYSYCWAISGFLIHVYLFTVFSGGALTIGMIQPSGLRLRWWLITLDSTAKFCKYPRLFRTRADRTSENSSRNWKNQLYMKQEIFRYCHRSNDGSVMQDRIVYWQFWLLNQQEYEWNGPWKRLSFSEITIRCFCRLHSYVNFLLMVWKWWRTAISSHYISLWCS